MNVKTIRDDTRAAIDDILGSVKRAGELARERLEELAAQAEAVVSFLSSELASPVLEKAAALFVHEHELSTHPFGGRPPGNDSDVALEVADLNLEFRDTARHTVHRIAFAGGVTHLRPGRYRIALVFLPLEDAEGES